MTKGSISMTEDDLEGAYKMHDPNFAGHQSAQAVEVGPEGITVVASANQSGDSDHTWVLRLNLDGVVNWERHYDPTYGNAGAITRLGQGEFVLAGEVQRSAMANQASLLHIDATGAIVGAAAFGPRGITGFNAVQSVPGGMVVAGGISTASGWLVTTDSKLSNLGDQTIAVHDVELIRILSSGDMAVLGITERPTTGWGQTKLLLMDPGGKMRWARVLPTAGTGRGEPAGLIARNNAVLAVGNSAAGLWLASCDRKGAVTWERTLAAAGAWAAVELADGFAVAGATITADNVRTQHIWRFADDGTLRSDQPWNSRNLGSGLNETREWFGGLAATSDGGLVLVGSTTRGPGKTNVWIVRLAPDGKVIWERIFGKPAPKPT